MDCTLSIQQHPQSNYECRLLSLQMLYCGKWKVRALEVLQSTLQRLKLSCTENHKE